MSQAWQKHEREIRRQGGVNREGLEHVPEEAQELRDPDREGEPVVKTRLRHRDAAIGLDSDTARHGDEEVNIIAEQPERIGGRLTGDIIVTYVARGADDRPRTYEQRWEKTGEGQHTARRPRRIFT